MLGKSCKSTHKEGEERGEKGEKGKVWMFSAHIRTRRLRGKKSIVIRRRKSKKGRGGRKRKKGEEGRGEGGGEGGKYPGASPRTPWVFRLTGDRYVVENFLFFQAGHGLGLVLGLGLGFQKERKGADAPFFPLQFESVHSGKATKN